MTLPRSPVSRTPWIPATNASRALDVNCVSVEFNLTVVKGTVSVTDFDLALVAVGVERRVHRGVVLTGLVHLVDLGAQRRDFGGLPQQRLGGRHLDRRRRWPRWDAASSTRSPSDVNRRRCPDRRPHRSEVSWDACNPSPASRSGEPATNRYDPSNSNAASATARIAAIGAWNICATTTSLTVTHTTHRRQQPALGGHLHGGEMSQPATTQLAPQRALPQQPHPCQRRVRHHGTAPLACNVKSSTSAAAPNAKCNTRPVAPTHRRPPRPAAPDPPPPTAASPTPRRPPTPPSTTNAVQPTTASTPRSSLHPVHPVVPHRLPPLRANRSRWSGWVLWAVTSRTSFGGG